MKKEEGRIVLQIEEGVEKDGKEKEEYEEDERAPAE